MKTERNILYDNVKFFLICCVVLGHLGDRYADKSYVMACAQFWVYLFHMPAFIYISGIFSKKTVKGKKYRKVVPYIFLFLVMKILIYAVEVYLSGIDSASIDFFHENGVPWFALSMFWWYAATILIQDVQPYYVLGISVFLSLISGYNEDVNSLFVMQRTIIFFPFFYIGYLTDPVKLQTMLQKWKVRAVSMAVIIVTIAVSFIYYNKIYYWRFLFRGIRSYGVIQKGLPYAWGWTWRTAAYLISFVLTLAVISVMPNIKCFVSDIGKRTLPVYVFHSAFISISLSKIVWLKRWVTGKPLSIHCIVFMLFIVVATSLKPFDWMIRKIMSVPFKNRNRILS